MAPARHLCQTHGSCAAAMEMTMRGATAFNAGERPHDVTCPAAPRKPDEVSF
jgi:hypothetical protein